jgi:hypothetical protein
MPGIDSSWATNGSGSATADGLADVLGALCGEFDEHAVAALISTQPTAITTRTHGKRGPAVRRGSRRPHVAALAAAVHSSKAPCDPCGLLLTDVSGYMAAPRLF